MELTSGSELENSKLKYKLKSKVWVYQGPAAWHFITLNKKTSSDIRNTFGDAARGFGSLPVRVTIGTTKWNTSIFPDSESGCYMLPLKKQARKEQDIHEGDTISYQIEVEP